MDISALIIVKDLNKDPVMFLQKNSGGHPKYILRRFKEIFGNSSISAANEQQRKQRDFEGIGCLAASVVASLKERCGDVYLFRKEMWMLHFDFVYEIYVSDHNDIMVKVVQDHGDSGKIVIYDDGIDTLLDSQIDGLAE